jgi:hypothetical protein
MQHLPVILLLPLTRFVRASCIVRLHAIAYSSSLQCLAIVLRGCNIMCQIVALSSKLKTSVDERLQSQQREFYLRQQLRAIKEELGEEVSGYMLLAWCVRVVLQSHPVQLSMEVMSSLSEARRQCEASRPWQRTFTGHASATNYCHATASLTLTPSRATAMAQAAEGLAAAAAATTLPSCRSSRLASRRQPRWRRTRR